MLTELFLGKIPEHSNINSLIIFSKFGNVTLIGSLVILLEYISKEIECHIWLLLKTQPATTRRYTNTGPMLGQGRRLLFTIHGLDLF